MFGMGIALGVALVPHPSAKVLVSAYAAGISGRARYLRAGPEIPAPGLDDTAQVPLRPVRPSLAPSPRLLSPCSPSPSLSLPLPATPSLPCPPATRCPLLPPAFARCLLLTLHVLRAGGWRGQGWRRGELDAGRHSERGEDPTNSQGIINPCAEEGKKDDTARCREGGRHSERGRQHVE